MAVSDALTIARRVDKDGSPVRRVFSLARTADSDQRLIVPGMTKWKLLAIAVYGESAGGSGASVDVLREVQVAGGLRFSTFFFNGAAPLTAKAFWPHNLSTTASSGGPRDEWLYGNAGDRLRVALGAWTLPTGTIRILIEVEEHYDENWQTSDTIAEPAA